jgi:hypothetical protein
MLVFPRCVDLALPHVFDRSAPAIRRRTVWFGREEYGGEREILLAPSAREPAPVDGDAAEERAWR